MKQITEIQKNQLLNAIAECNWKLVIKHLKELNILSEERGKLKEFMNHRRFLIKNKLTYNHGEIPFYSINNTVKIIINTINPC